MFNELADFTLRIREVEAPAVSMPEEQVKMIDTFKDSIGYMPRNFEYQKFWLMNDGSLIPVGDEHAYTSHLAGINIKDLLDTGAARCEIDLLGWGREVAELAVEFWKKLTDEQIHALTRLSARYAIKRLIVDHTWSKEDVDNYETEVKSPEHVGDILRYGPVKEATLSDIHRKQRSVKMLFPTFDDRVKNVQLMGGIRLKDVDDDNWHFQVHSGTKKDVWYDCTLHFKNIQEVLERYVKDRRLWVDDRSRVDLKKLAATFIDKVHVQVFCSCPAFLYYGSSYILGRQKYDAKYTDPEYRPPNKRNPKQYGAVCKHYTNVLKALPFYTGTIAKWLRDFYARDIAGYEKEAMREFGWFRKAAVAMGKRKVRAEKAKEKPPEKKPETEGPEAKPGEETRLGTEGNIPAEGRENERVNEVVTLPEPQKKILDTFGEADKLVKNILWSEEGNYKFWLLNDGTLISVGARQVHNDITKKAGAKGALHTGAIRGHIDNSHELDFDSYNNPTEDQIETLKNLVVQYGVKSTTFYGFGSSGYIKALVKSPDHLEHMIRYGKIEESTVDIHKQLPGPQQKLVDAYGTKEELGMLGHRSFWLMSDGSVVPVEYAHYLTAGDVGVENEDLFNSGALRGILYNEGGVCIVIEGDKPNSSQIGVLKDLFTKYGVIKAVIELKGIFHDGSVKSAKHLGYLLKYGQEGMKERVSEEVVKPEVISKRLWGKTTNNLSVYTVDGELVRNEINVEFTEGGHDLRYNFIPEREVWIENMKDPAEHKFILLHELHERRRMNDQGLDYKTAHEDASRLELYCRKNPGSIDAMLVKEGWMQ